MAKNLPATPDGGAFATWKAAATPAERMAAGRAAVETVEVPGIARPVPRFMFDLPWAGDDENQVDDILARLAGAEDIEKATKGATLRKPDELIGHVVEILDVRCVESDIEDAKWGAYVSMAVSVDNGPVEVVNSGHGQVAVTLWRCFCEGRLPVRGTFVKLGNPKPGRNQPLGFELETEF